MELSFSAMLDSWEFVILPQILDSFPYAISPGSVIGMQYHCFTFAVLPN